MNNSLLTYQIAFKTIVLNLDELKSSESCIISKVDDRDFLFVYNDRVNLPSEFLTIETKNNYENDNYLQLEITNKSSNNIPPQSFILLLNIKDLAQASFESVENLLYSINLCRGGQILGLIIQKLINDFELYFDYYILKEHYLKIWGVGLKHSFIDTLLKLNTNSSAHFDVEKQKLEELRQYIVTNVYKNAPSIEKMAFMVNMSPTKFKVYFKKYTGYSPHQYILTVRLTKAFELLSTGKFSISQVAYKVGFSHPASFSRFFKQKFYCSPTTIVQDNVNCIEV